MTGGEQSVGLSPSPTSTLSSLTPSPEPASPSRKRPRLSATSPPPAHLSHVQHLQQSPKQPHQLPYSDLLEGLDERDFGLPSSSIPAGPNNDQDEQLEDSDEEASGSPLLGHEEQGRAGRKQEEPGGAADDSGVGLLPDVEPAPVKAAEEEPPDDGAAGAGQEEDFEFEGDDMWADFDDSTVGFDQPSAFPSSMLSADTTSKVDKGKGRAVQNDEDDYEPPKEGFRLADFGFADLNGGGAPPGQLGAFVFATRKPFLVSEEAMKRSRALLEADDAPEASTSTAPPPREPSMPPPPVRTSTPLLRPTSVHSSTRPSPIARPASRPSPNRRLPPPPLSAPKPAPSAFPGFGGFATAAGTSVPLPSAEALAKATKCLTGSSSPPRLEDSSNPPAPPPAMSLFAGFQSAGGRTMNMPSEEALRKMTERFDASSSPPAAPPQGQAQTRPSRPPSRVSSAAGVRDVFEGSPAPVKLSNGGAGLAKFALPPMEGVAGELAAPPDSPTAVRVRKGGSVGARSDAGSGGRRTPLAVMDSNLATVSTEVAMEEEKQDVSEDGSVATTTETLRASSPVAATPPAPPPTSLPPSLAPLPPIASTSIASLPAATAPASPIPILAPVAVRPALPPPPSTASRPTSAFPIARPPPFRSPFLSGVLTPARGSSTAFTPLRPSSLAHSGFSTSSSTPIPPPTAGAINPLIPPPPTQRRLNLGMTPRSKPFHLANTRGNTPGLASSQASRAPPGGVGPRTGVKAFKTPFKGGKAPEGLTPVGLKGKMEAVMSVKREKPAREGGVGSARKAGLERAAGLMKDDPATFAKREKAKVFEMDTQGGPRFDLFNYGMRPMTHYYEHLESLRLPSEILDMDSLSAASFVFPCGRSHKDAYNALKSLVAERMPDEKDLVTLPWVQNHWSMVVWKLASYVRSRPDLKDEWWNFERVMDQLRYRYEREINFAQRSCLKRIQERDSPPHLPMVLCVSQIRWDEVLDDSAPAPPPGEAPLAIVGLELTDGWYRVRTNVDATLKSACERGKVVVGSKIAIMGAKLDSSKSEGKDPLSALSSSSLIISGNSTSLVPWHARLGFHDPRHRFINSLDRLTSQGGVVSLVDVVIERAYPCGFIDLRKGRGTETWGEEEELARQEEWKRGREKIEARLADQAEKAGVEEDEVVELLQEAVERLEPASSRTLSTTPGEEPDEILDRLDSASNKHFIIRKLSPSSLRACLALAQENAQASRYRAVEDLQKELAEKYPIRDVRGFRVFRVRDAREGSKPSVRTALVTVWDAQSFEEGFFREGGRYLISNTMPKGKWRRVEQEISLTTRRDSRWEKMAVVPAAL